MSDRSGSSEHSSLLGGHHKGGGRDARGRTSIRDDPPRNLHDCGPPSRSIVVSSRTPPAGSMENPEVNSPIASKVVGSTSLQRNLFFSLDPEPGTSPATTPREGAMPTPRGHPISRSNSLTTAGAGAGAAVAAAAAKNNNTSVTKPPRRSRKRTMDGDASLNISKRKDTATGVFRPGSGEKPDDDDDTDDNDAATRATAVQFHRLDEEEETKSEPGGDEEDEGGEEGDELRSAAPQKKPSKLLRRGPGGEGDDDIGDDEIEGQEHDPNEEQDDAEQSAAAEEAHDERLRRDLEATEAQKKLKANSAEHHPSPTVKTNEEQAKQRRNLDPSRISPPLFSVTGLLNTYSSGVSLMGLRQREWYHQLVRRQWKELCLYSLLAYVLAVVIIGLVYFGAMRACGANSSVTVSFFFSVASIAANGGYTGEPDQVLDPDSSCYAARAVLVMICSYINVVLTAVIAASFLAKASTVSGLRHRIIFSEFVLIRELEEPMALRDRSTGKPERTSHAIVGAIGIRALAMRRAATRLMNKLRDSSDGGALGNFGGGGATTSGTFGASSSGLQGNFANYLSSTAKEHRYLSYVLQFRVANLHQAFGYSVLSGELRVFLFTQEIADRHVRSVRARSYELPWVCLNEQHDDCSPIYSPSDPNAAVNDTSPNNTSLAAASPLASSSGNFNFSNFNPNALPTPQSQYFSNPGNTQNLAAVHLSDSKTLRLWFPATIDIALSAFTENRACRLLHRLLLRHSRGTLGKSPTNTASPYSFKTRVPLDTNVDRIFDFQLLVEYRAQDTGSGGGDFVARHTYGPSAMLRGLRFADTCSFLSKLTAERVQASVAAEMGSPLAGDAPPPPEDHEPALEVDYRRFNATTVDD